MIYRLTVPGPIDGVAELHLLEWHVSPDQEVAPGAMLVELETHKVVLEVRAGRSGFMRRRLCQADGWIESGAALALLSDTPDEALPDDAAELPEYLVAFEIA